MIRVSVVSFKTPVCVGGKLSIFSQKVWHSIATREGLRHALRTPPKGIARLVFERRPQTIVYSGQSRVKTRIMSLRPKLTLPNVPLERYCSCLEDSVFYLIGQPAPTRGSPSPPLLPVEGSGLYFPLSPLYIVVLQLNPVHQLILAQRR